MNEDSEIGLDEQGRSIQENFNELEARLGLADAVTEDTPVTVVDRAEVLRLSFGNSLVSVDDSGSLKVRSKPRDDDGSSFIVMDRVAQFNALGLSVNLDPSYIGNAFDESDLRLCSGCGVVTGPANVGKSPILKWIVSRANALKPGSAKLVRFGEPLPGYITLEAEAGLLIAKHLMDPTVKIIAIDSIKDLLVTMSYGGTMARGVPRAVFRLLSQWGAIAASLGKLIVVPLNISTDDANALAEVNSAVLSNSTLSIIWKSGATFVVTERTGESKMRRESNWQVVYKNNEPVVTITEVNGSATAEPDSNLEDIRAYITMNAQNSAHATLISNSLRRVANVTKG